LTVPPRFHPGGFHDLLSRYSYAHIAFIMRSTACNAAHTVEQRLARWLLMAHDRVRRDEFPLTSWTAGSSEATSCSCYREGTRLLRAVTTPPPAGGRKNEKTVAGRAKVLLSKGLPPASPG
jgi:hypothetical protein